MPEGRIALHPAPERDGARLMIARDGVWDHHLVRHLTEVLHAGDLLVVNDTRVLPARLRARRKTGGAVEVLLLSHQESEGRVPAMLRPGRRLEAGEHLALAEGEIELVARRADGTWWVRVRPDPWTVMERLGEMPLPPYIDRRANPTDRSRYQTVFADQPGAVAAPTAGLHLTRDLLETLREREVRVAQLTLHVGPGTFRNLRPADLQVGTLHPESYAIPEATRDAVAATRARGGRVVAVGTTTTRALETATDAAGNIRAGEGTTELFIRPGYQFRQVDRLLTNFHLPRSSLLMLVCAFGGTRRVLAGYAEAMKAGYRFYSYGDAMLLDRATVGTVR